MNGVIKFKTKVSFSDTGEFAAYVQNHGWGPTIILDHIEEFSYAEFDELAAMIDPVLEAVTDFGYDESDVYRKFEDIHAIWRPSPGINHSAIYTYTMLIHWERPKE